MMTLVLSAEYTRENSVVYDSTTALSWQDDGDTNAIALTWKESLTYCTTLSLTGLNDWRTPNINELMSIVDYTNLNRSTVPQALNTIFTSGRESRNWSSTTTYDYDPNLSYTHDAYYVYFKYGYRDTTSTSNNYSVRCVRGGKN